MCVLYMKNNTQHNELVGGPTRMEEQSGENNFHISNWNNFSFFVFPCAFSRLIFIHSLSRHIESSEVPFVIYIYVLYATKNELWNEDILHNFLEMGERARELVNIFVDTRIHLFKCDAFSNVYIYIFYPTFFHSFLYIEFFMLNKISACWLWCIVSHCWSEIKKNLL